MLQTGNELEDKKSENELAESLGDSSGASCKVSFREVMKSHVLTIFSVQQENA